MSKGSWSNAFRSSLASIALAGALTACAKGSAPSVAPGGDPFRGRSLYIESRTDARKQANEWREFRPDDAALMNQLSKQPTALWLRRRAGPSDFALRAHLRKAQRQSTLPSVVIDGLPNGDCEKVKAGDLESGDEYRLWIASLRDVVARTPVVLVLEPNGLTGLECLPEAVREERITLLREAAAVLEKGTRAAVYLAAGSAGSEPPAGMAALLQRAGIADVRGFALNVGDYVDTKRTITYGIWLAELVGNRPFIVDTSRNGFGSSGEACNARGRALGIPPTTDTRHPLIDAYLWLKTPGESDGECNDGPPEGEWWPKVALELVRNTPWIQAAALLPSAPTPPLPPEPGPRDELEFTGGQLAGGSNPAESTLPPDPGSLPPAPSTM